MKILFQGDSITDAGRDRTDPHNLGNGYPKFAAEFIRNTNPDKELEFLNFGISGNRTCQLFDRLYNECIAFKPDIVSILIGVNDIWHRYGINNIATTDEQIELNLRCILKRIRKETGAKIILIEPFVLDAPDKDNLRRDVKSVIRIEQKLAKEYADAYIPLNSLFAEALKFQPEPLYYSKDGVHPNENGARFIAEIYKETVNSLIN